MAASWASILEQPLDAFIDSIHSRNGFSRARMSEGAAEAFDAEVEALIRPHAPDGVVRLRVYSTVRWSYAGL